MLQPGLYAINTKGFELSECFRVGGAIWGPLLLTFKAFKLNVDYTLLPAHNYELTCDQSEISNLAIENIAPHIDQLKSNGFKRGFYTRLLKTHSKTLLEAVAYTAIHDDGYSMIHVGYTRNRQPGSENDLDFKETTAISATIYFENSPSIALHTHKNYMNAGKLQKQIYLKKTNLPELIKHIALMQSNFTKEIPRSFQSAEKMHEHMIEEDSLISQERIKRYLFVKVADDMVPVRDLKPQGTLSTRNSTNISTPPSSPTVIGDSVSEEIATYNLGVIKFKSILQSLLIIALGASSFITDIELKGSRTLTLVVGSVLSLIGVISFFISISRGNKEKIVFTTDALLLPGLSNDSHPIKVRHNTIESVKFEKSTYRGITTVEETIKLTYQGGSFDINRSEMKDNKFNELQEMLKQHLDPTVFL